MIGASDRAFEERPYALDGVGMHIAPHPLLSSVVDRLMAGVMVGDAFAFIDPVFSTGVYLAMSGGRLGADVVDACLKDPAVAPRKLKEFERVTRRGLKTLSWLIYRFTSPTIRRMFMGPRNVFRVEEAVISLLAGDLFGGTRLRGRLLLFKAIYYGVALTCWRQNLAAYLLRKRNVNSLFTEPSQAKEQLTRP